MTRNPIDQPLADMAAIKPEIDDQAFSASVWQRIHNRPNLWRVVAEGFQSVSPGVAWRAAPAALALIVGSVSGAAMAADRDVDPLDVFSSHAPYSISALADLPKDNS
tara:strand:+ start:231 stop:551 length:321 start_codon:yes stop_codon:yes gene_type:complete